MTYWKVLNGTISAIAGTGYRYPGKNRWTRHLNPDQLKHYVYGYHVAEDINLLNHVGDGTTIWEAEICPDHEPLREGGKVITCRVRLVERLDVDLVLWAADCAERVLPLLEDRFPGDAQPHRAIEAAAAARAWAADAAEARTTVWAANAAAARAWAANAAAAKTVVWAAAEARTAVWAAAAARAAVWAAAEARAAAKDAAEARAAAKDAAWSAEREWQYQRLLEG